jgi:hypothetical protein
MGVLTFNSRPDGNLRALKKCVWPSEVIEIYCGQTGQSVNLQVGLRLQHTPLKIVVCWVTSPYA